MDFTRFINSRDIREYIKRIGYEFNTVEAAWLVWQSTAHSPEKHKAWEYIISHMPDVRVEGHGGGPSYDSLHDALRSYMDIEHRWLCEWSKSDGSDEGSFFRETGLVVYRIRAFTKDGESVVVGPAYSNWSMARDHIMKDRRDPEYVSYTISRELMHHDEKKLFVSFTPDGEAVSVYSESFACKDDFILYSMLFSQIHLVFPTPFKAGDVLCCCSPSIAFGPYENTFVFSHMTDTLCDTGATGAPMDHDAKVHGYFLLESSVKRMVKDNVSGYMNLEYYRGDTDGKDRIFNHFSDYAADLVDETALCENYRKVISGEGEFAITYYEEI